MSLSKPIIVAIAYCASCLTLAEAGPRLAGGDVTLAGTLSLTETNRVSPNASSSSDTIYSFTPSISYARESARMNLNANLSFPMRRYEDNDRLDSNAIDFGLNGEIPFGSGPRLSGSWGLNYFQGIQASYLTNRNLDSETFTASANADYVLQRKLSARARASYNERDSTGVGNVFTNKNSTTLYAVGLHSHNLIRGRIGAYVEYKVQKRETDRGAINRGVDDTDDGVNFGVNGQILPERLFPKLDADLSFGFTSTSGSDRGNRGRSNRLTLNGRLAYPLNAKTNVALNYNRNLAVTDDDRTVEQSQIKLSVDYAPQQRLGFSASIGAQDNDFIYDTNARNDDVFTASFNARYSIRSNWYASFGYNLRDSSSNIAASDYQSEQFVLSTTLTY